jgi:hypothetical protein
MNQEIPQATLQTITQSIPLEQVNIIGYIIDNLAKVNCEFTFGNKDNQTINPIHYFSLAPNSTICNLTMLVGTTVLKGQVQEKNQASNTYKQAQTSGKKTALVEKISGTDYKLSVGNVEPDQRVIVSFDYVGTLELDDDFPSIFRYKFTIPTNMSVKYFSSNQSQKDWEYQKQTNKIARTTEIPYQFDFDLRWLSSSKFIEFESNIKSIQSTYFDPDNLVIFKGTGIPVNRDFDINVYVKTEPIPSAYAWYEKDKSKGYVVASIKVPNFIDQDISNLNKKNYQFILDRSGSMGGNQYGQRINKAKQALKLFVEKIPPESYFNVISFGNEYSAIWSNSVPAHDFFKQACLLDIESYTADMGGTEIHDCLQDCLSLKLNKYKLEAKNSCPDTYENIIIILTDGDVGSIDKIFQMVKSIQSTNSTNTRIFSFGLGTGASKQFIKGISDLTFGDYLTIGDSDDFDKPIGQILNVVNKQYYTGISLLDKSDSSSDSDSDSDSNSELKPKLTQSISTNLNSIYPGKNYTMCFEASPEQINKFALDGVIIQGFNPITSNPIEWKIKCQTNLDELTDKNFDFSIIKQIYSNELVNKLTHSLDYGLLDIDEKKTIIKEIIGISVDSNIMNSYTSFVLVDKSGEYDVKQIGKDVVVPHSNKIEPSDLIKRKIGLDLMLESFKNTSFNNKTIQDSNSNPISHKKDYWDKNIDDDDDDDDDDYRLENLNYSAGSAINAKSTYMSDYLYLDNKVYSDEVNSDEDYSDEVNNLEGGMDMFGGGKGGYYKQKYNTDINWHELNKLLNITNGSYKFLNDSWKLLGYLTQKDFDEHCTQVQMTRVLYYNFIILLELMKNKNIKSVVLREYFETKYPGLFDDKKNKVEKLYLDHINQLKSQKVYVDNGDY